MASKKNAFTAPAAAETETEIEAEADANPVQTLIAADQNIHNWSDAVALAETLGTKSADGFDSWPRLAMNVADWAAQGIIDPNGPTKAEIAAGTKKPTDDHIEVLFNHFANAETRRAANKRTAGSIKSNKSKLRAHAKLGARKDLNASEILVHAQEVRNRLIVGGRKVKTPLEALTQVCRDLNGTPGPKGKERKSNLTELEIEEAVGSKSKGGDSVESLWRAIDTAVKKLLDGMDQGEEAASVHNLVQIRKSQLTKAAKFTRLADEARELGFTLNI